MRRRKRGQRIISFEEYTAVPRTKAEIAVYWSCLRDLQQMGWVDDELNVLDRKRPAP